VRLSRLCGDFRETSQCLSPETFENSRVCLRTGETKCLTCLEMSRPISPRHCSMSHLSHGNWSESLTCRGGLGCRPHGRQTRDERQRRHHRQHHGILLLGVCARQGQARRDRGRSRRRYSRWNSPFQLAAFEAPVTGHFGARAHDGLAADTALDTAHQKPAPRRIDLPSNERECRSERLPC